MKILFIICTFLLIIFNDCTDRKDLDIKIVTKFDSISSYQLFKLKNQPIEIGFSFNGKIKYLSNRLNDNRVQIISFFDNGNVESKTVIDSLGKIQGRAYFFFKGSGNLSSDYNYFNDKKYGNAVSFFDSTAVYKTTMLYNEEGQMYWRQTLDKNHNVIKEEGKIGN